MYNDFETVTPNEQIGLYSDHPGVFTSTTGSSILIDYFVIRKPDRLEYFKGDNLNSTQNRRKINLESVYLNNDLVDNELSSMRVVKRYKDNVSSNNIPNTILRPYINARYLYFSDGKIYSFDKVGIDRYMVEMRSTFAAKFNFRRIDSYSRYYRGQVYDRV